MKSLVFSILNVIARSEILWKLYFPFMKIADYLNTARREHLKSKAKPMPVVVPPKDPMDVRFESMLGEPVVKSGPFKGMKYPSFTSYGSTMYPKIIGCYEMEIQSEIARLMKKNYGCILDVGCAEGYYAVGLAMKLPGTKVLAYDIDAGAASACRTMAQLNNVSSNVLLAGACTPTELAELDTTIKTLIICDCEGYEKHLFNTTNVHALAGVDLLIETHDFLDIDISKQIRDLFESSHDITVIKSVSDIEKARSWPYLQQHDLSLQDRKALFREGRPDTMEWLIIESRVK